MTPLLAHISNSGPVPLPVSRFPLPGSPNLPPGLAEIVAAWPELPEAIRAGILAMVKAAAAKGGER